MFSRDSEPWGFLKHTKTGVVNVEIEEKGGVESTRSDAIFRDSLLEHVTSTK